MATGRALPLPALVAALALAALAGCTTIREGRGGPGQRLDPWENWNRKVFNFNEDLDNALLKPVATAYTEILPEGVRRGVSNFYANFSDAWSAVNNMLQGKFALGFEDVTRVITNTLFGLGGVFDVASEMGIDHKYEDFGQTLGHYGVGAGAYVVLPILAPRPCATPPRCRSTGWHRRRPSSTVRDGRSASACCSSSAPVPACSARPVSSTRSRSTSTPSFAMPTCSDGAA